MTMQIFQFTIEDVWYGKLRFSPDGRWLALNGKSFALLDTTGQAPLQVLPLGNYRRDYIFVRGGTALAYIPNTSVIADYDLTSAVRREFPIVGGWGFSLAAEPRGETIFLYIRKIRSPTRINEQSEIRVLDVRDYQIHARFGEIKDELRGLKTSTDGNWLLANSFQRVRAWHIVGANWPAQAALCAKPRMGARDAALAADGRYLAIVSSRGLEIWNTASRKCEFFSGKHRHAVTAVACSPTNSLFVSGDNAGKVFLWDFSGRLLTRFDWGLANVFGLCFSPDGLRCAAMDKTGKVVIWDTD